MQIQNDHYQDKMYWTVIVINKEVDKLIKTLFKINIFSLYIINI